MARSLPSGNAGPRSFTLPGPVASAYYRSRARWSCIMGPPGSAKSSTSAQKLLALALAQKVHGGVRKCRTVVVRRIDAELRETTIRTWLKWFPEGSYGRFYWSSPYVHEIRLQLPDGTRLEWDVIFWAVDRADKVEKLGSFEVTNAWVNEAREVDFVVLEKLDERINRYPSMDEGGPAVDPCVICDSNAPPEDHWWPIMAGHVEPPKWMDDEEVLKLRHAKGREFFTQPAAVLERRDGLGKLVGYDINPDAENLTNLPPDYYVMLMEGKSRTYIKVQLQNQYGARGQDRSVHPDFNKDLHVADAPLPYDPRLPLVCGMDFGRTPAVLFGQLVAGQLRLLAECLAEGMGVDRFCATRLRPFLVSRFPEILGPTLGRGYKPGFLRIHGDPAGDDLPQTGESTPLMILRAHGLDAIAASTNDPTVRLQAVDQQLCMLAGAGEPALIVDPACSALIAALAGGYVFKKLPSGLYEERPLKNRHSHVADALQYLVLGTGGGLRLLGHNRQGGRSVVHGTRHNPLSAGGGGFRSPGAYASGGFARH